MSIFVADEQAETIDLPGLRSLAELVLSEEGYPSDAEVTLLLVSDAEMSSYNARFLDRDGPTDVLAFPVEDLRPGVVPDVDTNGPPLLLGDIIIAPSYISRQAEEYGVSFEDEISLMVVHGLLHLLGYDHQSDDEAEEMENRERQILAGIGKVRR
ncbi:MAG: rRNA maturation RNase YbeY [Actinobacteria bacterium]|nr:MAG: rRNA maturation RNase YbeY [Actinomycetota bacterium]